MNKNKMPHEELFKELRGYVEQYDSNNIDKWFEKNKFFPDIEKKLVNYIFNETYFFSFSSNLTGSSVQIKKALNEAILKRHKSILKHLSLQSQVALFSSVSMADEVGLEHFKVLHYDKNNKEQNDILLKDPGITYLIVKLFNKESFTEIEEIEKWVNLNLLENKSNYFALHRAEKNFSGVSYVKVQNPVLSPYDDIIFNYTDTKKQYIEDRNISLKHTVEAKGLLNEIISFFNESDYFKQTDYVAKAQAQFDIYAKEILFIELNQTIKKKSSIKSSKI